VGNVYIVLSGEFEIRRRKLNKLTKKEHEFKKVKAMNESVKSMNKTKLILEAAKIKTQLPTSQIIMGRVGQGSIIGHDDFLADRPYSKTVVCMTKQAEVYSISSNSFEKLLSLNLEIKEAFV